MKKESLLNRILASLVHVFSILLTFALPIAVYFISKNKNKYLADHAKEGMNLHFTFFPIFLALTFTSHIWSAASVLSKALLVIETILIIIAAAYALKGKIFAYPVIRYFKI
ncbi:DUF4870 domain-containing protein [Paenibacillus sp. N3/727]|uniref:DUF4870 domain-containing protein n=1 Tax=Paenibacillus sp. N3/727 TaxID=2925845 RepID=UPI001F53974C|nr:DUF4870 domain-containing protein [Paenibacillus sp. N3/727]UNK19814.1 DUF4870 domain-containing protein [Paenibacillus sp. N3/727]